VLERAPEHRGAAALLFDRARDGQIVYERIDWDHPRHRRFYELNREFISLVSPLESALTEDPLQVMFTGTCGDMRDLYERLAPGGDDDGYAVTLTEYQFRDFSLVDVIRAGCSKGSALRELAAARGVDPREVMAVGDNMNDLSMLEFAGCPVVMGNGVADLRGRGWPIAPTNDEAGVAAAIGTYILDPASIEG
jgi:hydroxymethylpyrimidine pyrophosphatase-like HAD family hydrolase